METSPTRTVLLVEDHAAVARLIQGVLGDHPTLRVPWVQTLAAALAHLRETAVDLVLLDLGLPDSQGLETVARVVEAHPTLAVVVLTAREDETLARAALAAGAEAYLVKGTLEPGALVRAIEAACERKRTELALREAHGMIRVQDGIVVYDRALRQQVWNPDKAGLTGVPAADAVGRHAIEVSPFADEPEVVVALRRALAGEVVTVPEIPYRAPGGGREGRTMASFSPLRDAQGAIVGVIGYVRDITLRKQAAELLRALSAVDALTGLPDRRGFLALAQHCLTLAKPHRTGALLLLADVDGLTRINETKGRLTGDQVLRDVGGLLKRTFRASDVLGRLRTDEFAVLALEAPMSSKDTLLGRLEQHLHAHNAGRLRPLSLSVGIAHYDGEHPCSVAELLAQAEAALDEAKREKKAQQTLTD